MYKIANIKGNESTIRIVKNEKGQKIGIFGSREDLIKNNLIIPVRKSDKEKWLLIKINSDIVLEFNDKEQLINYLHI